MLQISHPEGRTEKKTRKEETRKNDTGRPSLMSKAHSFIFKGSLYTLSCAQRIIGGVKSCKVSSLRSLSRPGFLFCKLIVYKWFR